MGCDRGIGGAALSADSLDGGRGGAGHDSVVPVDVLGTDGGGDHGWVDRGDGVDLVVLAGLVCGVVPGEEARTERRLFESLALARRSRVGAKLSPQI